MTAPLGYCVPCRRADAALELVVIHDYLDELCELPSARELRGRRHSLMASRVVDLDALFAEPARCKVRWDRVPGAPWSAWLVRDPEGDLVAACTVHADAVAIAHHWATHGHPMQAETP